MICRNASSAAAKGFFEAFYRWGRVGIEEGQRRKYTTPLHPTKSRHGFKWTPILIIRPGSQPESAKTKVAGKAAGPAAPKPKHHEGTEERTSRTVIPGASNPLKIGISPNYPRQVLRLPASRPDPETATYTPLVKVVRTYPTVPDTYAHPPTLTPPLPSATSPPPEAALSKPLRHLMRSLPHSVVILTTANPLSKKDTPKSTAPRHAKYRGLTLSSFQTISLAPKPLVSFAIQAPSSTLDTLLNNRHFLIHVLSATPPGVRLASLFANRNIDAFRKLCDNEDEDGERVRVVEELAAESKDNKALLPRLEGEGVLRVLRCEIVVNNSDEKINMSEIKPLNGAIRPIGSHFMAVGEVVGIVEGEEGFGLGYSDGEYRGLGPVVRGERLGRVEV